MECIEFRARDALTLSILAKNLHHFFASEINKSGRNQFGLTIDNTHLGALESLRVWHVECITTILKQPKILRLVVDNRLSFDLYSLKFNDRQEVDCSSLMRNRNFEKQSPKQALKRFESSKKDIDAVKRMKSKIVNYLESKTAYLPIQSSSKNKFTIRFKAVHKTLSSESLYKQNFEFNSYGLSTQDKACYLPNIRDLNVFSK